MKKFVLFIIIVALSTSANSQQKNNTIYSSERTYTIDFTPFAQKGFLITPEKYSGQYEAIGIIGYEVIPEAKYKLVEKLVLKNYGMTDEPELTKTYDWVIDSIPLQSLLTRIYDKCIEMGADAYINFNYEFFPNSFGVVHGFDKPVTIYGIRISGFAIKRKDK